MHAFKYIVISNMQAKGLIVQAFKEEKVMVQLKKRSNSMMTEVVVDEASCAEISKLYANIDEVDIPIKSRNDSTIMSPRNQVGNENALLFS